MKLFSRRSLRIYIVLLLLSSLLLMDASYAQRRGGGRRGGRGRSRGNFPTRSGASPRVNRDVNLQNRGNFDRSSGFRTRERPVDRSQPSQIRQQNQQTLQDRQDGRTERTETRQDGLTTRQENRQNFIDDNYYRGGWYGGGYYVPAAWGWAGVATGLAIGASVASPPPYYDTVDVGSTTYIYSDGIYFQQTGSDYVVVEPPNGIVVSYLPEGCIQTEIQNETYYNCNDIYYQPFYQNGSTVYRVVKL